MRRTLKVIFAVVLSLGGLVGVVLFLMGQGLDRAEKWVSLIGVFLSIMVGVTGLVLGWRTWRLSKPDPGVPGGRLRWTGNATATGPGSWANSGSVGGSSGTILHRTGDAQARGGGRANTGEDCSGMQP